MYKRRDELEIIVCDMQSKFPRQYVLIHERDVDHRSHELHILPEERGDAVVVKIVRARKHAIGRDAKCVVSFKAVFTTLQRTVISSCFTNASRISKQKKAPFGSVSLMAQSAARRKSSRALALGILYLVHGIICGARFCSREEGYGLHDVFNRAERRKNG